MSRCFTSVVLFLKTHNLSLTKKKKPDKPRLGNILQDTWPVLLKMVKVIKNEETLRNLSLTKGGWRGMTSKSNVMPWTGSWDTKRMLPEKLVEWNKLWALVVTNVLR